MQRAAVPIVKDLVLAGGGHAHVAVLKSFGMDPVPGVRVTLISAGSALPYSGMVPGFVAGHYDFDEAHIDARRLCHFAGANFYQASVTGIDLNNRKVECAGHPPVSFDLLSINTGSTPSVENVPGARELVLPVKPIDQFLEGWGRFVEDAIQSPQKPRRIAVVGGGAGGVELTLAAQYRLAAMLRRSGSTANVRFDLLSDSDRLLPTHNRRTQSKFMRILAERGVDVHLEHRVVEVKPGKLLCRPGTPVAYDLAIWVTSGVAPPWLRAAGVQTDDHGFLALNPSLQSLSHPFVFGAGDVAAVLDHPRPKSGVFAVRQGRPLAENLRRALMGQPLEPHKPQRNFLSLISTGNQYAVASRGAWASEGSWVWRLKDYIDRRWMRQYQEPAGNDASLNAEPVAGTTVGGIPNTPVSSMRCGGCGAKVGGDILARVLQRLKPVSSPQVVVGLRSPDDASVSLILPGKALVQTVDFFRSFVSDPYMFGRIAANHSLNDVFAMGAVPQTALAVAVVPPGVQSAVEEQLFQIMSGAVEVLNGHETALTGGHTAEGLELAFGLVVNGAVDPARLMRKGGLHAGDRLILTKSLGTGTIFAAEMRVRAKNRWVESALAAMLVSNRAAAECFQRHGVTACTDVTGFGLLGHLVEMLNGSPGMAAVLEIGSLPLLPGAIESVQMGMLSSIHPQNLRARGAVENLREVEVNALYPILFDPQTAGGLLGAVPAGQAHACLDELKRAGYREASLIGEITTGTPNMPAVLVRD